MRYERWCAMRGFGARLVGDASSTAQERAEAKRARKAAKRVRDAERMEKVRLFGSKAERARWARNLEGAISRSEVAP